MNEIPLIIDSRHSHHGTPPEDAGLHLYQHVNPGPQLVLRQQMQWKDDEEQQLIGADKLDSQHNKALELVIFRTLRRLCAPVHVALVIMI